jgi:hypothetical protein
MKPQCRPEETNMHDARTIHVQRCHGCSPGSGFAEEASAINAPVKMTMPTLPPRVKESYAAVCVRIERYDLRSLCIVAYRTGIAQIVRFGFTSQCSWKNVVNFECVRAQLLL